MNKLTIGTKIALGFGVILVLLLVIGIISFRNLVKLTDDAESVAKAHVIIEHINNVKYFIKAVERGERGFIITGDESFLDTYYQGIDSTHQALSDLSLIVKDISQKKRLEEVKNIVKEELNILKNIVETRRKEGLEAAKNMVVKRLGKNLMTKLENALIEMENGERTILNKRKNTSVADTKNAEYTIGIATGLAFIIVIFLILFYSRIIARPIKEVTKIAERISIGDLSTEIAESNRKDEIGQLSLSFKTMQSNLNEKAMQIKEIASGNLTLDITPLSDKDTMGIAFKEMSTLLRNQIIEISEGVNVLASSTSEIMATVTQLSSSSAETATSVGETTTTVEEVKQTAEVANQKAKQVSENAAQNAELSKEGSKAIQNTIEGMNKIKQQMESIATLVVRLSEQSQTIGEITTTVNELAEQSNLLAVNAAIEAAKAGEQGKGFTVVAQEIKNLAERSKEATLEVRNILKDVQKSISSSVMTTEEGGKAVEEGIKLTESSGEVIKALSDSVSEAANAAFQIAASSQQQLEGMDQVASAMENIKESSVQSAASTKQSAAAVNELHKLGEKLKDLMKFYKVTK
ncbi:MAG: methyl-accepting chemotaxis protein [bacterium]